MENALQPLLFLLVLHGSIQLSQAASSGKIPFVHLTTERGLSQNTVHAVFQDKSGFIWFGTQDGLNRFDGYSFTTFEQDPQDTTTISDNFVRAIVEDLAGNLWIATQDGLNRFDPDTERFSHYQNDPRKANSISANNINSLCLDRTAILWIATQGGGLNQMNPTTGEVSQIRHDPSDSKSLRHDNVISLFEDQSGTLWIGTAAGLQAAPPSRREFVFHDLKDEQVKDDAANVVVLISKEAYRKRLFATQNGGVIAYNPRQGWRKRYHHSPAPFLHQ